MHIDNEEDSEVDVASKAAGDTHIVDVTNEFIGSQGIIDNSTDGADFSSSPEAIPSSADGTCSPQADTEVEELADAVASVHVQGDLEAGTSRDVELAVVLGGMDTGGEIFDDCLVFRLTV